MNAITPPAVKPGKIWYWLGALSILAGLVVGGILMANSISTLSKTVDNFGRVRVPGGESCKLVFDKPGRYTIYYEFQTKIPQRDDACNDTGGTELITASTSSPLGLDVTLKSVDKPESAPLKTVPSTSGDVSISLNGHSGKAIREVQIDRPGDYVIEVSGRGNTTPEPYVLAVGRGAIASVASRIVSALAIAGLGGLLGLILLIVTGSKRRKHRQLLATQIQTGYPGASTSPYGSPPQAPWTGTPVPPTPWSGTGQGYTPPSPPPPPAPGSTPPPPPPPAQWGPPS
jgi:hypothetical protein